MSDVHGRADALARAKDGADALVCLGDLLLFVDYADHGAGVLGELFGAEAVGRFVELRTDRRFDEARAFSRSLWAEVADREAAIAAATTRVPVTPSNVGQVRTAMNFPLFMRLKEQQCPTGQTLHYDTPPLLTEF